MQETPGKLGMCRPLAKHGKHASVPGSLLYLPISHTSHAVLRSFGTRPAKHSVHTPNVPAVPFGQRTHAACSGSGDVPCGQVKQARPSRLYIASPGMTKSVMSWANRVSTICLAAARYTSAPVTTPGSFSTSFANEVSADIAPSNAKVAFAWLLTTCHSVSTFE